MEIRSVEETTMMENNDENESIETAPIGFNKFLKNSDVLKKILIVLLLLGILLIILSIALFICYGTSQVNDILLDYTNCKNIDNIPCSQILIKYPERMSCSCLIPLNLTEPEEGSVSLLYDLKTFDISSNNYQQSKDERQLKGDLSHDPSPDCGKFMYVQMPDGEKKPIAPCGAIANSMFNDTFELYFNSSHTVPVIFSGLDGITKEDKKSYRNPPDLKQALQNYSKPMNWPKNVWEKNIWEGDKDPANSGFQNEAFIAWMKTDMRPKPAWRVNHTDIFERGLPAGRYSLRVRYAYPNSMYSGERKAILRIHYSAKNIGCRDAGIVLIILGTLVIAVAFFGWVYNKKNQEKESCVTETMNN